MVKAVEMLLSLLRNDEKKKKRIKKVTVSLLCAGVPALE